ncbi:MAG: amidohydrolase [Bacteroidales bacterium]|nr:amidohydrolase [Bacteroidales bacterium]
MSDKNLIKKLQLFRQDLHKNPELSGKEIKTQKRIIDFLSNLNPDKIFKNIGGYGVAYIFDSGNNGPIVLFRADMDALPITEANNIDYISTNKGVAHLCGHDGHTAVLCGVANMVDTYRPVIGKLVILFQPAEETGAGAELVIKDKKFEEIKPDCAFGFHNLPGYQKNTCFIRYGTFSSASTGVIIKLKGLSSHAAYPEDGNNPDKCLAELINEFNSISTQNRYDDFVLVTVIHAKLGEVAFGTTPGDATIMLTIRSYLNRDMDNLIQNINSTLDQVCKKHKINHQINFTEHFPANRSDEYCVNLVKESANTCNIDTIELDNAFRWSEDFGHFASNFKSAFFGIGSGLDHPQLHNENYDFPDEIIATSIKIFFEIYKNLLIKNG